MKENEYFTVHRPFANVYHIEDRLGVHATLIVGEKQGLLIDTGSGIGDLPAEIAGLTDKPVTVVNTHGHIDHFGGNYQFEHVLINPKELAVAEHSVELLDIRKIVFEQMKKDDLIPQGFDSDKYYSYDFGNLAALEEDAVFDLGGLTVRCVPMYSHTPGMTGFYVEELKLLIGGDSVCPMVCLYFDEASDLETHLAMLREVGNLPFEHILASHSSRLMDRNDFSAFIECAENYDEHKTVRYRDPYYPSYGGRMFVYENNSGNAAIIVYNNRR